jgi:hypothetical protein
MLVAFTSLTSKAHARNGRLVQRRCMSMPIKTHGKPRDERRRAATPEMEIAPCA